MAEHQLAKGSLSNAFKRKITVKDVMGGKIPPVKDGEGTKWLCDVFCYVTGNKLEESDKGEYYRWLGQFKAINLLTGEIFISSNAIFPSVASDLVQAAYVSGNKIGGDAGNVFLGFRIGISYMKTKYAEHTWELMMIQEPDRTSPLDAMIERVTLKPQAVIANDEPANDPDGGDEATDAASKVKSKAK